MSGSSWAWTGACVRPGTTVWGLCWGRAGSLWGSSGARRARRGVRGAGWSARCVLGVRRRTRRVCASRMCRMRRLSRGP
eukprot:423416-Rhodomonas_salina.1